MFDPRLEQNEEGLFDAPHIELIWMMNTGRFKGTYYGPYSLHDIVIDKNMTSQYINLILR